MSSNLPRPRPPGRQHDREGDDSVTGTRRTHVPGRTTVVYQYSSSGRVGGVAGLLLAALLLVALVGFVVVGALALTVALWIALGAVIVGAVIALVRGLFGGGRGGPTR